MYNLSPQEISILTPPEPISVEWIEKNRTLTRTSSNEPGSKRLSRTPALLVILEWFSDSKIREITIRKPAQIGLTDLVVDLILWIAMNDPSPVAFFFSDQETARKIMKYRIEPAFKGQSLTVRKSAALKQDQTKFEISLGNGFFLTMAWGSSIALTGSMSYKYIFGDELDKPGYDAVKKEGETTDRIEERQETFDDSKIVWLSTPALDDGRITQKFNGADVIYDFLLPCPHCGKLQAPSFQQVTWEGGHLATKEQIELTARIKCVQCEGLWTNDQRREAVSKGVAHARCEVAAASSVAYQLHRLDSLFKGGDLANMILRWNKAHGNPLKLQGVVNSVFGEPFTETLTKTKEIDIKKRIGVLPKRVVPNRTIALTAGFDMQKYGFWVSVWAWRKKEREDNIESFMVYDDYYGGWEQITDLVFNQSFTGEDGKLYKIWRAGIDTGGGEGVEEDQISRTAEAYHYLRHNGRGVIFGTKGMSQNLGRPLAQRKVIDKMPGKLGVPIPGGIILWHLDVKHLKDQFFWRLKQDHTGPEPITFHSETTDAYLEQIQSEEKQRSRKTGKVEWVRIRENHQLDTAIINAGIACEGWDGGISLLSRIIAAQAEDEPTERPGEGREEPRQGGGWLGKGKGWNRR